MRLIPLFLILLLGLSACQTLDTRSDARKLESTLDSYGTAVRWQPLASLYGYLQPELQPAAPPAGLDNIRVTGYEITGAPRQLAKDRVVQSVTIEYVLVDSQRLRTLVDNQLWVRTKDGDWERANPIPDFK
jgi:hypothetical protein